MKLTIKNAFITLEKYLKPIDEARFHHSFRVAKISAMLAKKWHASPTDAIIAGLLHDIGKSVSPKQMLELCSKKNLPLYDFEIFETHSALHSQVSRIIFEELFDNSDIARFNAISHAIFCHNTGDSNMSLLDKIIFIADNIEPNRKNNFLAKIQANELTSPDECIRLIIDTKMKQATQKNREFNPLLGATLKALENER